MALKLQTYKGEKPIQIIYKTSGVISAIFIFAILLYYRANRGIENLDLPFNIFITILFSISIITTTFLFILMKDSPKGKLWNLTDYIYLFNTYVIFNGDKIDISQIKEIVIDFNLKNIPKTGSENKITFQIGYLRQETLFFLDNMNQHNELEEIIGLYKTKTTAIVKT